MIDRLHIKNFQSIQEATIDLAKLTVIVGPSNSGKSAIIRALTTLALNTRSPGQVTRGKKAMLLEASLDGHTVSLERGEAHSVYSIDGSPYPKSGSGVPQQVSDIVRLPVIESNGKYLPNFASQFDKPFLMDSTGSAVARILGSLTNIDRIAQAARTGKQELSSISKRLKVREDDLDSVKEQVKQYSDLKTEAETISELSSRVDSLVREESSVSFMRNLAQATKLARTQASMVHQHVPPKPPTEKIEEATEELRKLLEATALAVKVSDAAEDLAATAALIQSAEQSQKAAETELHQALEKEGICPLCKNKV